MSNRRYCFNGIDWIFFVLDGLSRKATGCGTQSQVILRLTGPLGTAQVKERLALFSRLFPVISGRYAKSWGWIPSWSYSGKVIREIPFEDVDCASDQEAMEYLYASVNKPFTHSVEHLRFIHVRTGARAYVSLVFDHCLLDAHGAQYFLWLFHQYYSGLFDPSAQYEPETELLWAGWGAQFAAGKRVACRLSEMMAAGPVKKLSIPKDLSGKKFQFRTEVFSSSQSVRIRENAYSLAGYLMVSPYLLAGSMSVFDEVFARPGKYNEDYVIQVNGDTRSRKFSLRELFFNHHSFFFLRFPGGEPFFTKTFIRKVRRSIYDAMAEGFMRDIAQAARLLRVLPKFKTDQALQSAAQNTFIFSFVNRDIQLNEFCGAKIDGVIHTPRLAVSHGVGVFFSQSDDRFAVTLVFMEGVVSDVEADIFIEKLKNVLLGGI